MESKIIDLLQLTQAPVKFVDLTPDNDLPLRILRAYREDCNCRWATDMDGNCDNLLFSLMNKHCEERAIILDNAIEILEKIRHGN